MQEEIRRVGVSSNGNSGFGKRVCDMYTVAIYSSTAGSVMSKDSNVKGSNVPTHGSHVLVLYCFVWETIQYSLYNWE